MNAAIWSELGIEPTRDARAIRRAYATRLKQTRPESDPDGFSRLRNAFEAALRFAEGTAPRTPQPVVSRPRETISVVAQPTAIDPTAHIVQLADAGKTAEAAAVLADAIDRSVLPLATEMALKDRLLLVALQDRNLDGRVLAALARRLGWHDANGHGTGNGALLRDLSSRIEAENWYEQLVATSRSRRYRLGDEPAAAARLLTGAGDPVSRFLPPCAELRRQLSLYRFHRRWIEHRFDAATIAAGETMAERVHPGRLARFAWKACQFGAILAAIAASSLVFLAVVFSIPYCRIQGFSRPGLLALGAIMLACAALSAILPAGILSLIISGSDIDRGQAVVACAGICLAVIVGIKQLFLPGKRTR